MKFLSQTLKALWSNDQVRRVAHTFWQAAFGVLAVGLLAAHSTADVKATVFLAATTGAAAVKALYLGRRG